GNQLYVSSNGMITFGSANSSLSNTALASGPAQAAIAPFWDDMITDATTGAVLAKKVDVDGNGINDYLIIEWNDIHHWANPGPPAKGMFQTILALNTGSNNGDVVFNYQGTTFTSGFDFGSSATVGIKNVGTSSPDALQVSLNTATNLVRDHNAIRITTQNLASSPDPLAAANTFGYRAQK